VVSKNLRRVPGPAWRSFWPASGNAVSIDSSGTICGTIEDSPQWSVRANHHERMRVGLRTTQRVMAAATATFTLLFPVQPERPIGERHVVELAYAIADQRKFSLARQFPLH